MTFERNTNDKKGLLLSQVIDLTLQGEGKYSGEPITFFRTAQCNLRCEFCDSSYSWDKENEASWKQFELSELVKRFPENCDRVNCGITGGEPLLQQKQDKFKEFIGICDQSFKRIIVETNGTVKPDEYMTNIRDLVFSVSPKLTSSGVKKEKRYRSETLKYFSSLDNSYFKFVVNNEDDIQEILNDFDFVDPKKIYLMPEGQTQEELSETTPFVIDQCLKNGFMFSGRLHVNNNLK